MDVERCGCNKGLDVEEVVEVNNLSRTERGILYRLNSEPALLNRFT